MNGQDNWLGSACCKTATSEPENLTYEKLLEAMDMIKQIPAMPEVIFSDHIFERETVTRTMKERLLSWPWKPLEKTKVIEKPAIYEMRVPFNHLGYVGYVGYGSPIKTRRVIVCHSSFKAAIEGLPNATNN